MNNITIAGQLGKDSELKQVGQEQVLSFSVADSQGRDKPTIWWRCQLWGKRATSLQQYLTKGQAVTVSGSVTQRTYTDKNGQEKVSQDVRVQDVALQGGKRDETPRAAQPATRQAPAKQSFSGGDSGFSDMNDDVPFADPMKRRAFALSV
jgi:single-strand DNA-binding protein